MNIEENNMVAASFLRDSCPLLEENIKNGMIELLESTHLFGVDDSLDILLESFAQYFL